ncbi:uncharacterized protein Z520_08110 [Fonsecaea multimorphosa CBS 102226]|uniref:Uncharacterized protein n=1 Tax=Fonsecaea multimorphosa CBS 102226 TaxID=1442371 RepID=A0A0D2JSA6_9EURO|nr:uncharacterized protein Z520_08110 [Fonsecaea multimorphosa CBS 102226]KIX96332.1 hypothetical protein Z520_08110 [Fonsecaea multimorphosa CBS 102226]OAL21991.1 hypothetical protein AYO22_07588 [Fonsecaea multimorphosa]
MTTYFQASAAWRTRLTSAASVRHCISGFSHPKVGSPRHPLPSHRGVTTVVDQTKHDNNPDQDKRAEHVKAGKSATSSEGRGHPAKQPDPQKPPERSTGFETEGPDGKSGEGKDTGGVHKQEKPELTP